MDTGHEHHHHHNSHDNHYDHHSNQHDDHQGHAGHTPYTTGHQHGVDHQAYFSNNFNVTVLLSNWVLHTRADVFIVCVVTCILAVGYQCTKWLRQYLHQNFSEKRHSIKSKEHLFQTFLYLVEFLISYILMLVVMTYNIWVFVVTILGLGAGYFAIGWHRRIVDQCAEACPSKLKATPRALSYEKKSSDQELLPLDNGTEACANCACEEDLEDIKETDILT